MALYHFTTKPLSRGTRNTVGAVAYRAGCQLEDLRTGERFDYTDKSVQHVELVLPVNSPSWSVELQELINQDRQQGVQALSEIAEAAEKRIDARVWREFEFSLHRELTDDQNIVLAREFAQDQLCGRGMIAQLNFHFDRDEETGEYKPHCHVLTLTRPLTESGLSLKKERDWNKKELLKDLREQWAAYSNFHLKLHGHDVQIDHRSYYERGIDIEPQPKQGRNVLEQERRLQTLEGRQGPFTDKGKAFQEVELRNLYRILRNPETILDIVTRHHTTFMWADVQEVLHRYIDEQALFKRMEDRLKNSKELVVLHSNETPGASDQSIYTTREMLKTEISLVERAETLAHSSTHIVDQNQAEREIIRAYQSRGIVGGLSQEQEKAIQHLLGSGQLKCVVGIAGSGKTTLLGICHEVWKAHGYAVYGLAPTGKAAQNLEQSGIRSTTVHKFLGEFDDGRCQYKGNSVLVLDEAGMVDVERFSKLLEVVQALGVKLIVVGDGAQLQPVEAGPAFRLVTERVGKSELTTVLRQKESWQRDATTLFGRPSMGLEGRQHTQEAIQIYQEKGHIHIVEETIPSLKESLEAKDEDALKHLYAVSSYIAPRLYREMARDLEKSDKVFPVRQHQDYSPYLQWKEIKKATEGHVQPHKHHEIDVRKATKESLLKAWHRDFSTNPEKSSLMLAFMNKDVSDLNTGARFLLKRSGHLEKEEFTFKIKHKVKDDFGRRRPRQEEKGFSKGDRIVFTRNNYGLGVRNGSIGTITEISSQKIQVKLHEGKVISFAPALNPYFDHGWAITIHKSQGSTVDKTYVLASYNMTKNLTYVAMTRHREDVQVLGSSLDFWRAEKVQDILSASGEKLAVRDYLNADSLENLRNQEDKRLSKFFTRLSDELQALGIVSKKAFTQMVHHFLGKSEPHEVQSQKDPHLPKSIREETRAETLFLQKEQKPEERQAVFQKNPNPSPNKSEERQAVLQKELNPPPNKAFEEIASYIKERLHDISANAGTHVAHKAHEDLHRYMTSLKTSPATFQAFKEHNPQLIKDAEQFFKEQDHHVERSHGKGMELGM